MRTSEWLPAVVIWLLVVFAVCDGERVQTQPAPSQAEQPSTTLATADTEQAPAHLKHRMAEFQSQRLGTPPPPQLPPSPKPAEKKLPDGKTLYTQNCAMCHQPTGVGIAGSTPPLAGSEWVTGNPDATIRILSNGLLGEIKVSGKTYNDGMAGYAGTLTVPEIAAIINYTRSSWGNSAKPITADDVKKVQKAIGKRDDPWTEKELSH